MQDLSHHYLFPSRKKIEVNDMILVMVSNLFKKKKNFSGFISEALFFSKSSSCLVLNSPKKDLFGPEISSKFFILFLN